MGNAAPRQNLWAIILAGGEGVRLRPLIRRLFGDDRPKQYARLLGSRSLLGQTVARAGLAVPRDRMVVVTHRAHGHYVAAEFGDGPGLAVLPQPYDRGTAAGVLYPACWISWRDPDAIVAVFPSDHFILEEARFMQHVVAAAELVRRSPERLVLLGARPTRPEPEYGWIQPAARITELEGEPVSEVEAFWEKPSPDVARRCFAQGHLWNTFVFVGTVQTLIDTGRRHVPMLVRRLERIGAFAGTPHEAWATHQAYLLAPRANFSQDILEACPERLAVSRLPNLTWCDWGTPERVIESLRAAGLAPFWVDALAAARPAGDSIGRAPEPLLADEPATLAGTRASA
ncbi:MAG TPA: sugar phosphate nucleotidyltransferase [Methylomirabilota bacterium]|nr:sugar phosphate nucleotidyltransferase [Methylomirabilota bacterium]